MKKFLVCLALLAVSGGVAMAQKTTVHKNTVQKTTARKSVVHKNARHVAKRTAYMTQSQLLTVALRHIDPRDAEYAVKIVWKESRGNPWMRNKRSTSHGLNGFLRSTWTSVSRSGGIRRSLEPDAQFKALRFYVENRVDYRPNVRQPWSKSRSYPHGRVFRTAFEAAWAHHELKGWY